MAKGTMPTDRWSDWNDRWQEGRIGFHLSHPNPTLERYLERLTDGPARIYVPLCGKSLDLPYLASRGHTVVGVEFVEKAVQDLFADQGLPAEREERAGHPLYRAERLELHVADALTVTGEVLGPIDAVYDRAALIALAAEQRPRYAERVLSLLPPGRRMLLITLAYDDDRMAGPPFSVSDAEVARLYGSACALEVLEQGPADAPPRFAEEGLEVLETAWLLTKR